MSVLRDKTTGTAQFRRALEQIAILLLTEASKRWPTLTIEIETPLAPMTGATAAIAELPQMELPQAMSMDMRCGRPSARAMR